MPAQGRGAFSTPRAPLKPPPPPPHRAPVPVPHISLAHVVGKAVAEATHAVAPATHAAQRVQPRQITHAASQAASRAVRAPTLQPDRGQLPLSVLKALIEQHPLVRYGFQNELDTARLNQRAQAQQITQQQRERAKSGAGGPLDLGFVNLTGVVNALAGAHVLPSALGIASKLGNEAIDLPAQTFLSSAIAGNAGARAAKGDPKPALKLLEGILQQAEHPVRSFEEAPLSTGLLFAGGENVLGRVVGKAGRAGLLGERAAEAFSTERAPLHLYGDLLKEQSYNKDPLRKGLQVLYEKDLARRGHDPFQADGRRLARNTVGGAVKPGRVDYIRAAGERTRRIFLNTIRDHALRLAPKHGRDAVPLIFQGIVKTPKDLVGDLRKEEAKLQAARAGGDLTSSQMAQNKANLERVQGLLNDHNFLADPGPAFDAARRLRAIQKPFEAILVHGGVLAPEQLRAKLFPYAQAHMGAVYDGARLVGRDGKALTDQEIIDHMHAHGVEDVGFMSHKGGLDSSGSFYQATTRLPGVERHARTGSAFEKGVSDHSWEALVGSLGMKASRAAQMEVRVRELNQLALHPHEGGFKNREAARAHGEAALFDQHGNPLPAGMGKLTPVHLGPDEILQRGNINPADLHAALKTFGLHNEESLVSKAAGKYGLIPEEVNKRLEAHNRAVSAQSNVARGFRAYQNFFRAAKLNTSVRHIAGVGAEQAIRAIAEQAGPTSYLVGKKFDDALKHAAEVDEHGHLLDDAGPLGSHMRNLEAQLGTRGGQVQGYKDTQARNRGKTWSDTSATGHLARLSDGAVRSKAGRAALAPWHAWSYLVEGSLARLEHATHHALLGRALKESGFIENYRSILKAQDEAMHELVTTGLTPSKADLLARKTDDFMGNWSHLTPDVRKAVAYVTPFGLWWLNSMRWLYRLPVTHPIKTAIVAALYHASEPQRSSEGQGFAAPHKVPDFLQGQVPISIPGLGKGKINPTYYSPGGTLGPEALNIAAEQIAPALASPLLRGLGIDPLTLDKQRNAQGADLTSGEKRLNALAEVISGPLPGATQLQQVVEGGGKPTGTANLLTDLLHAAGLGPATTKPGTSRPVGQILEKMFLPVRFTYDKAGVTPTKGGGSLPGFSAREQHRLEAAERASSGLTPREAERLKRAEDALSR